MRLRRIIGLAFVLVLAALLIVWLGHRSQARAAWQSTVIATSLEHVPVASRVVGWFVDEPAPARTTTAATLPATVVRPGARTAPAIVLLVPGDTSASELLDIADAQDAIARADYAAWALRVSAAGSGVGSLDLPGPLRDALRAISRDPRTRGGAVSVLGVGADASRALVVAADPALRDSIRAVVAVQPVADVRGLLRLAVTGDTREPGGADTPHPAAARIRRDAGRALVQVLREHGGGAMSGEEQALLDDAETADDPIDTLSQVPPELLAPDLRAVRQLLAASSPAAFDAAWQELPGELRAEADARSPSATARRVAARVLVVLPTDDADYPAADGRRLAELLPHARVRETPAASGRTPDGRELRVLLRDATWWLESAGRQ